MEEKTQRRRLLIDASYTYKKNSANYDGVFLLRVNYNQVIKDRRRRLGFSIAAATRRPYRSCRCYYRFGPLVHRLDARPDPFGLPHRRCPRCGHPGFHCNPEPVSRLRWALLPGWRFLGRVTRLLFLLLISLIILLHTEFPLLIFWPSLVGR